MYNSRWALENTYAALANTTLVNPDSIHPDHIPEKDMALPAIVYSVVYVATHAHLKGINHNTAEAVVQVDVYANTRTEVYSIVDDIVPHLEEINLTQLDSRDLSEETFKRTTLTITIWK